MSNRQNVKVHGSIYILCTCGTIHKNHVTMAENDDGEFEITGVVNGVIEKQDLPVLKKLSDEYRLNLDKQKEEQEELLNKLQNKRSLLKLPEEGELIN